MSSVFEICGTYQALTPEGGVALLYEAMHQTLYARRVKLGAHHTEAVEISSSVGGVLAT